MPLHACFGIWYISLLFPANQQRQMIKLRFCGEHEHTNLEVVPTNKAPALNNPVTLEKQSKLAQPQRTEV